MILGWDIGGVHTKAVALDHDDAGRAVYRVASAAFDIKRDPGGLADVLYGLARALGTADAHAVTMTAELSRAFRTKREGVGFVLDALAQAVSGGAAWVYTTAGRFVAPDEAKAAPLAVGASNWMATASLVARTAPNGLLIDIGSTSADIIPIVAGAVVAKGRTDPERLLSGELIYTGALRTPAEALVRHVPLLGGAARVAAESFATTGDAYLWAGKLTPQDYTTPTADGRPAERIFAGERLARLVCADREMLEDAAVDAIARAIIEAQTDAIAEGIDQVRARHATPLRAAVVTGLGDFIAADAARRAGLDVVWLSTQLGSAARVAPAAAVATLLGEVLCRSSSK